MSPSDAAWQQLISTLHASGRKAALAITGGGSGAVGELLRVPGGSRLLIEAQVPYDERALATFLGFAPAQACSADTAIAMAQSARARAERLVPAGTDLVGLGATAALVSDRPRKGEHRFHIAFANSAGIAHCTCVMAKGRRDRAAEEDLVSRAIVLWLARACGIAAPSPQSLLDADEHYAETMGAAVDTIDRLLAGELDRVTVQPDGQMMLSAPPPVVLFPGSFNPMHEGHVLLARVAEELRQQPLAFEISVTNVDKPPLAARRCDVGSRNSPGSRRSNSRERPPSSKNRACFRGRRLWSARIRRSGCLRRNITAMTRLRMHVALEEIANSGGSFLVAVRLDAAGRVRALNDIPVPRRYADLFTEIPEHRFRVDTSSSEIRARRRAERGTSRRTRPLKGHRARRGRSKVFRLAPC